MRVLSSPGHEGGALNPYNSLLIDSLPSSVDVEAFTWARAWRGGYDIVHVHWPEALWASASTWKRRLKLMMFLAFAIRCLISQNAVWTVHNVTPHDDRTRASLLAVRAWAHVVAAQVHLTEVTMARTPAPLRGFSVEIPHGVYPRLSGVIPARKAYALAFGTIRQYKNFDLVARLFAEHDMGTNLVVAGEPQDAEAFQRLSAWAASSEGIELVARRLPDAELAELVSAARLVLVPYNDVVNSGVALFALSHGTAILAPRSDSLAALRDEVGHPWVQLVDDSLTAENVREALRAADALPPGASPDLDRRSWDRIGDRTTEVYRCVARRRSARRMSRSQRRRRPTP